MFSSVAFALHHGFAVGWNAGGGLVLVAALVGTILAGAMGARLYERSGGLVAPWISHALVEVAVLAIMRDVWSSGAPGERRPRPPRQLGSRASWRRCSRREVIDVSRATTRATYITPTICSSITSERAWASIIVASATRSTKLGCDEAQRPAHGGAA